MCAGISVCGDCIDDMSDIVEIYESLDKKILRWDCHHASGRRFLKDSYRDNESETRKPRRCRKAKLHKEN